MSDRARSSVRTGSRSGPAGTDVAPDEGAVADQATEAAPGAGTSVNGGSTSSGPAGATAAGAPAAAAPAKGASSKAAPAASAPAKNAPAKNAPAKNASAGSGPADSRSVGGDTATVHPGTPLVPGAGPSVPPAAAPPAGRGSAARPPADATQAVQFPPGGRPQGPPAAETGRSRPAGRGNRGPRRARLQLRHIDIWSAFKISLCVSFALFFVWMIAIGILYFVLSKFGVFNTVNDLVGQLGTASGKKGSSDVVHVGVVLGGAAVIGLVNVVLLTALSTVATYVYNLFSDLVGGLEVTLAERE